MRKVTASAVILTAITGCSQSEVPSASWNFDDPASQQLSTEFASQPSVEGARSDSTAQAFLGQVSRSHMGPAFAQPGSLTALQSLPPSGTLTDAASLVTESKLSGLGTSPGSLRRSDPLASVRDYLKATSSVSDIVNRVPYSSQVYLPEAPVYSPTAVSSEEVATLPSLAAPSFSADIAVDASRSVADMAQASSPNLAALLQPTVESTDSLALSSSASENLASIDLRPSSTQSDTFTTALESPSPESSSPQALISTAAIPPEELVLSLVEEGYVEENYVEESYVSEQVAVIQDTLPVLSPAQLVLNVPDATNATASAIEPAANEPVSVGTALLQTLARNGDSEALATLAAVEESESGTIEISIEESVPASAVVIDDRQPTLAGLLASMPSQDEEPLILSAEAAAGDSQVALGASNEERLLASSTAGRSVIMGNSPIPAFNPLPLDLPLPEGWLRGVPTEGPAESELLQSELIQSESLEPELLVPDPGELGLIEQLQREAALAAPELSLETAGHVSSQDSDSPLLESFESIDRSAAALSVVYVPIPEVPSTDIAASFIREAIATLNSEARRNEPVAELTASHALIDEQSVFAESVLKSQSQSNTAEPPLRFSKASGLIGIAVEDLAQKAARSRKLSTMVRNHRQPVGPRQRIVWQ